MHLFRTLGSNTWGLTIDGVAYKVWRRRGEDANGAPRGWVWTVQKWQEPPPGPRAYVASHWRKLPPYGPKAAAVIAAAEQMLADVRPTNQPED